MSTATGSLHYSENIVEAMVNYMSDIFDDHFIVDIDTRKLVATRLLESGEFVEYFADRYDLESFITGASNKDLFSMKRLNATVAVGLDQSSKSQLVIANPDMDIKFYDKPTHPHGKAYAQRMVDTTRLLSKVSHKHGSIIDIGGNYLHYASNPQWFQVHCCTKLQGAHEHHRQVQRDVKIDMAELPEIDKCADGTENCDFQAPEAVSLHTIPNIDPDLWPAIFRVHGLEHVESVHHYDPELEVADAGFIPMHDMHWRVQDGIVEFYFDNDSSESYFHRKDWLLQYATTWTKTMDDWNYIVHYSVTMLKNGMIHSTFTRLDKSTVAQVRTRPQHRFTDGDKVVELIVPQFNDASGYSISDPRAYAFSVVKVPPNLFAHVYKFGVSNSTDRPDKPLSFDSIRDEVQVFNHTRRVNGTSFTIDKHIDAATANVIAVAMYLFIVKRAASNNIMYAKYTAHMKHVQKRWGAEHFGLLIAKAFSTVALMPLLLAVDTVSDALDVVAAYMRAAVRNDKVMASAQEIVPFRVLQPLRELQSVSANAFVPTGHNIHKQVDINDTVSIRDFYASMGSELPDDIKRKVEAHLASSKATSVADEEYLSPLPVVAKDYIGDLPDCGPDRDEWFTAYELYEAGLDAANDYFVDIFADYKPEEAPADIVYQFAHARIYEYGLYSYDVGLHEVANARQLLRETWTGSKPAKDRVYNINTNMAAEIEYFVVAAGKLQATTDDFESMFGMNPLDGSLVELHKHDDGYYVHGDYHSDYIMISKQLKIFNYFDIGKTCMDYARSAPELPKASISLVDGIPGCGKTHEIVTGYSLSDVYVCAVKSTVEDVIDWLLRLHPTWSHKTLSARVKTLDAYLKPRNKTLPKANILWCDEALMDHSGALLTMIGKTRCKEARLFGDSEQVKFIQRGTKATVMRFALFKYLTKIEYRNISARIPADVALLIRSSYPEWRQPLIKTMMPVMRSLSYTHVSDPKNAIFTVADPRWVYVTVLQADKGTVARSRGFINGKSFDAAKIDPVTSANAPVYSVHESQGRTYPKTRILRLNPHTVGVFDSKPHQLVMVSRAMFKVEYYSVAKYELDTIAQRIKAVMTVDDDVLRGVMVDTPEWLQTIVDDKAKKFGIHEY